jgi:hypothetical protein
VHLASYSKTTGFLAGKLKIKFVNFSNNFSAIWGLWASKGAGFYVDFKMIKGPIKSDSKITLFLT